MDLLANPSLVVAGIEIVVGLYLLTRAADEFVEGAANVASKLRISAVVIGAVVVGFGSACGAVVACWVAACFASSTCLTVFSSSAESC